MPRITLFNQYLQPIASNNAASCVTMSQFMQWLRTVDLGSPPYVMGSIPASPYDPVNIASKASFVRVKDTFYTFAQTQLGYTDAQMLVGFQTASNFNITPGN